LHFLCDTPKFTYKYMDGNLAIRSYIDYEFHFPNHYISPNMAEPAKHIIRSISLEYLHVMPHWAPATDAKSGTLRAAHLEYTVKKLVQQLHDS